MSVSLNARIPIFALSADPVTLGHLHLVEKALRVFGRLKVVVTSNSQKRYEFSLEERLAMCRKSFRGFPNVEIDSSDGLLADYAFRHGHIIFLRGIRTAADMDFEGVLEAGHRSQVAGIETVYLRPEPAFQHISSSLTKVLLREMGDLRSYVGLDVKEALEEKILGQYRICVTGPIASGKSFVVNKLVSRLQSLGHAAEEIDMDRITGEVYASKLDGYLSGFRGNLVEYFGAESLRPDGEVNKDFIRDQVAAGDSKKAVEALGNIIRQPLETELRKKLLGKKGILFLAAAVAGERDWIWHTNNHVLLLDAPETVREKRLCEREKISADEAKKRIRFSGTAEEKKRAVQTIQQRDGHGRLISFANDGEVSDSKIHGLVQEILTIFPGLSVK